VASIVEEHFSQWVHGRDPMGARIGIYARIRDMPYAVVPELNDFDRYVDILTVNRGSCMPKHLLMCRMFQMLGMTVLYAVYPFRWDEFDIDYPRSLRRMAEAMPPSHHLACKVEIEGRLVLVDATLDPALKVLGLPVNETWDGRSDTLLPIKSCDDEELYHPSEAHGVQMQHDEASLAFYREMNLWLDKAREV
jgi:hypothetical protein